MTNALKKNQLDHLCLLSIDAPFEKAQHFLQGQVTCDVLKLTHNTLLPGAFCTPQGRVVSTFWLLQHAQQLMLCMPCATVQAVTEHLGKFLPFYQATLTLKDTRLFGVHAVNECTYALPSTWNRPEEHLLILEDDKQPQIILDQLISKTHWQQHDLLSKWPWLKEMHSGSYLPHDLGLEKTGAVNFNKGCYSGQEIIVRMAHRGTPKRSLFTLTWDEDSGFHPEEEHILINAEDKKCGHVISATNQAPYYALAVLEKKALTQQELMFKGGPVVQCLP